VPYRSRSGGPDPCRLGRRRRLSDGGRKRWHPSTGAVYPVAGCLGRGLQLAQVVLLPPGLKVVPLRAQRWMDVDAVVRTCRDVRQVTVSNRDQLIDEAVWRLIFNSPATPLRV
jgi:hypothetical protein